MTTQAEEGIKIHKFPLHPSTAMDPRNSSSLYSHGQTIPIVDHLAVPLLQHGVYAYDPHPGNAQYYHGYGYGTGFPQGFHGYGYGIGIPPVQDDRFFSVPRQLGFWDYSLQGLQLYNGYEYGIGIPQVQDYRFFNVPWQEGFWNYTPQYVGFPFYYHHVPYHDGSGTWLQQGPLIWENFRQNYSRPRCQQNYVPWEVSSEEENHESNENYLDDLASEDGIENSQAWEDLDTEIQSPWEVFDMINPDDRIENLQLALDDYDTVISAPFSYPDDQIENPQDLEDDYTVILGPFSYSNVNLYIPVPRQEEINKGLQEGTILKNLKSRTYATEDKNKLEADVDSDEAEICVVCQAEYEDKETVGILGCGHEFHSECIKGWLMQKNVCPLCKETGLAEE